MRRFTGTLLFTLTTACMALGCQGGDSSETGEDVEVRFHDGATAVQVAAIELKQRDDGAKLATAAVVSDLPGDFRFEAAVPAEGQVELKLHNSDSVAHTVSLTATGLEIEFNHKGRVRKESLSFATPEMMNQWLATQVAEGRANCDGLPERFQDLPLQTATQAIAGQLVSNHGFTADLTRLRQVMCAQAAANPQRANPANPLGLEAWNALVRGDLAPKVSDSAVSNATAGAAKNVCVEETLSRTETPEFPYVAGDTGNIAMTCSAGVIDVDADCCEDDTYRYYEYGTQSSQGSDSHPFCNYLTVDGQPTRYAAFRFEGNASLCPDTTSTCSGDGELDTVTPFNCTFSGYENLSGYAFDDFVGATENSDAVAAWLYLQFRIQVCYLPGENGQDTIACQDRSVDTTHDTATTCDENNLEDCHCQ